MPYSPGVEDISGQLLARGRLGAAQAYSSGIAGISGQYEQMMKKREEDKAMLDAANATAKFLKTNGKYLGLDQDTVDEITRDKPGETVLGRHEAMATLMKNAMLKQEADKNQAQIAQAQDAIKQNEFIRQQKLAEQARVDAMNAQLRNTAGLGASLSTASVPKAMPTIDPTSVGSYMGSGSPGSSTSVGPWTPGGMPAGIGLGTAADMLASQRPTNMGGAGVMTPQMTQNIAALNQANPELMQMARMGIPVNPEIVSNLINTKMQVTGREEIAALKAQLEAAKNGRQPQFGKTPEGIPYAINASGGVNWGPANNIRPIAEERQLSQVKAQGELAAKDDQDILTATYNSGVAATEVVPRLNQIKQLYEHGAKSGWGQSSINTLTGAMTRIGLWDPNKQANAELLQRALGEDALRMARELYKGQGSVSDQERKRIDDVAANLAKSKGFNVEIVNEALMLADRAQKLETLRGSLRNAGKDPSEVAEAIRQWKNKNPIPAYGTYKPEPLNGGFKTQAGQAAFSKYSG